MSQILPWAIGLLPVILAIVNAGTIAEKFKLLVAFFSSKTTTAKKSGKKNAAALAEDEDCRRVAFDAYLSMYDTIKNHGASEPDLELLRKMLPVIGLLDESKHGSKEAKV